MLHPLLDLDRRTVVGHRGNCAHAPENTLESFRQAIALGVDALEFDVRISRDGQVVVFHDPTVMRTTGAAGEIATMTLDELRTLDAGTTFSADGGVTFPYRGRGVGISTLGEVLAATGDVPLLIEVKVPEAAGAAREVIQAFGAEARCVVGSFHAQAMVPFAGSGIALGAAPAQVAPLCIPALFGRRYSHLPFQAMSLPRIYNGIPVPLGALARAVAPAGVGIQVWTINSPQVAVRLWNSGIQGIISDDPAAILQARTTLG